jgi:hypothetical protein
MVPQAGNLNHNPDIGAGRRRCSAASVAYGQVFSVVIQFNLPNELTSDHSMRKVCLLVHSLATWLLRCMLLPALTHYLASRQSKL